MGQFTLTPEISVIIPVKNSSKTIVSCLDAIYASMNVDFEVLVVDDGCMDSTMDVVSKYKFISLKNNLYYF